MTVKLNDIKTRFYLDNASQVGSKQLFHGYSRYYKANVYISYYTIIAIEVNGVYQLTSEYFSSTTTRHKNAIIKSRIKSNLVDNFENLLAEIIANQLDKFFSSVS